jgi:hypothetical protein
MEDTVDPKVKKTLNLILEVSIRERSHTRQLKCPVSGCPTLDINP